MPGPPDTILIDTTIVNGDGQTPRYKAAISLKNGLIHSITKGTLDKSTLDKARSDGAKIIDCQDGKYATSPGFIDMHAHSDLSVLHTPSHLAKITQGVTTEVLGQDGISYAPVDDTTLPRIRKQIAGWNGNPSDAAFWERWRSVGEYLDCLERERTATNVAFLVPQGNLRMLVKGWSGEKCTQAEIDKQKEILARCLEEGAVGMSSGLTYVPGSFADDAELAQLCEVVRDYGGYYCPHHRSYGKGALQAYREMLALAKRTGVRLHLTHATMNYPENAGRANELLEMIDQAIAEGVEVSMDTYPYLPGSTTLASTLPSWAAAAEDKVAVLDDPEKLARIKEQALVSGTDGCHGVTLDWDILEIGGTANPKLAGRYVGKTIAQIAREQGRDPFATYIDILKEDDFNSTILSHSGHEGNVQRIMQHSRHTGGSDGILTSTKPHPRGWGTFARYIGHYGRDLAQGRARNIYNPERSDDFQDVEPQTIFAGGLEEAVAHITSRPAAVIGAKDRGLVEEGYWADLVVFDPDTILDVATYKTPQQPAAGIKTVLVNGEIAVDEGKPTHARKGRTIRSNHQGGQHTIK